MLVHAALEYLSWVTYVLGPLQRSAGHHDQKDKFTGAVAATWHLQELPVTPTSTPRYRLT